MGPNGEGWRNPAAGSISGREGARGPTPADGSAVPPIEVRPARAPDANTVASLHVTGMSEGFLPLLGTGFLRLLYRRIMRHPESFLFVAHNENAPVGFIAGSTDIAALYRSFLWRDGAAAALRSLGPVLRGWRRVLETAGHGSASRRVSGAAELLSVAVDPAWQSRGVARLLVASFLDEVSARGCQAAQVVVGADNRRAIALYERAGFVTSERFELHQGTESLLMLWGDIQRSPSPHVGR